MSKHSNLISALAILVFVVGPSAIVHAANSPLWSLPSNPSTSETDRGRDGLQGPVRRIRTETTKLTNRAGKPVEGQRQVLETAAYDIKGGKVENAYFPVTGGATLTGREVYKYDDKGNISEMTLLNEDGSLLSKEAYTYEYDSVGNWTRMTTAVAIVEGGKIVFEPTEVTYRTISYYLDESFAKMVQPAPAAAQTAQSPSNAPVIIPVSSNTSNPAAVNASKPGPSSTPKIAAAIPPSTDIGALSKNAVGVANNSGSVPGGTNASSRVEVVMDSEPPAKSAPKPLMKPVSGGVLNGKALQLPAPEYPELAKRMRAGGLVTVEVVIDTNGKVISAKAMGGNSILQQAATHAAFRARFSPTMLSGQPVKVSGVINYNFSLTK